MRKLSLMTAGVAVCLALGVLPTLAAEEAAQNCSLDTLHGTMAWSGTSTTASGPASGSGFESYDGKGHMKYHELWTDGSATYTYAGTGTYTITANCIATVIYEYNGVQSGLPWTYFVAPDGSRYFWNNNQNSGTIAAGQVDRISRAQLLN